MSDLYAEVTDHSGSVMKLSRQRVALVPRSQETGSGPRWRDERLASLPPGSQNPIGQNPGVSENPPTLSGTNEKRRNGRSGSPRSKAELGGPGVLRRSDEMLLRKGHVPDKVSNHP